MTKNQFIQAIIDGKYRGAEARRIGIQIFGKKVEQSEQDIVSRIRAEIVELRQNPDIRSSSPIGTFGTFLAIDTNLGKTIEIIDRISKGESND